MLKAVLALAAVGVLAAGCASPAAGVKVGAVTMNTPTGGAPHAGVATSEERSAVSSAAQPAPRDTVTGHATGLGTSRPLPPGSPVAKEPSSTNLSQSELHAKCPPVRHLGLVCSAP